MKKYPFLYRMAPLVAAALLLTAFWGDVVAKSTDSQDDWSSLETGKEVYEAACASCHGSRGIAADRSMRGFDVEPPDFTDCAFSTREQSMDWYGIAHSGGPAKSFSRLMPAFGEVLTEQQLEAVVDYIKDFCTERSKWAPGEFNLAKALNTGKAFPENEVEFVVHSTVDEPASVNGKFVVATRVGAHHMLEAALPVGVQQVERQREDGSTEYVWGGGAGDLVVAWKGVVWHSLKAGTIGALALDVFIPTGDEAAGYSRGVFAFEPALAIGQIIPKVGFIQLHGGAELSTDTDKAPHEVFWRGALGHTFRKNGYGRAWSPMVEILGTAELADETEIKWDIVPQLQVALSKRQHIKLGAGVLLPLTEFSDRQLEIQAYLLWDWFDGGFTEGW